MKWWGWVGMVSLIMSAGCIGDMQGLKTAWLHHPPVVSLEDVVCYNGILAVSYPNGVLKMLIVVDPDWFDKNYPQIGSGRNQPCIVKGD